METAGMNDYHARKTLVAEVQAAGRDILDKGRNPVFVKPKGCVDDYDIWCEIIQLSKMLVANDRSIFPSEPVRAKLISISRWSKP